MYFEKKLKYLKCLLFKKHWKKGPAFLNKFKRKIELLIFFKNIKKDFLYAYYQLYYKLKFIYED